MRCTASSWSWKRRIARRRGLSRALVDLCLELLDALEGRGPRLRLRFRERATTEPLRVLHEYIEEPGAFADKRARDQAASRAATRLSMGREHFYDLLGKAVKDLGLRVPLPPRSPLPPPPPLS
jgi:hypothetical protein